MSVYALQRINAYRSDARRCGADDRLRTVFERRPCRTLLAQSVGERDRHDPSGKNHQIYR